MMIESILGRIDGGKVLDVATQQGHFVQTLMQSLNSYSAITGIDINESAIAAAHTHLSQENVQFLVMDAEQLNFANESFDTVTISASFHHIARIPQVIDEMKRVLKPKGHFVVVEMHRDSQTEAELTSIYLHHWAAAVDTALGYVHNSTLARQEFVDYMAGLGLSQVAYYDYRDNHSDPQAETRIAQLEKMIAGTMQRAEQTANRAALIKQGEALRQRLHTIGAQREPILIIVGEK
jgi:ubiquinone/menaquinone biosynthesis C-methylase UbiE